MKAKTAKPTKTAKPAKTGKPTQTGKTAPKSPAIKIAIVRELATAFAYNDDPSAQLYALVAGLARLPEAQHAAAAAALLEHTRKGRPVARAYLQAIVDLAAPGDGPVASAAADQLARFCAAATSHRRNLIHALVQCWEGVRDADALDAAFRNLAQIDLDAPYLLAVGVEAATQRQDAAAVAERGARLARATRLQPIVEGLAGTAPQRKRAAAQLAALDDGDRRHVHHRMLTSVRDYDEAAVAAALLERTDDPTTSTLVLGGAICEARYHGGDALVAAWRPRAAAGEAPLIARLVEMFEALTPYVEAEALEPFIKALHPASGRPEVCAAVERALASEREGVRALACEAWLREEEGQRNFDDAQIDRLVRRAIAIAAAGPEDTDDRRAAGQAMYFMAHAGARHALLELVRTPPASRNKALLENAYSGLSRIAHPEVWPALIGRMFVETKQLWTLLEALAAHASPELHRQIMARLDARRDDATAARAANVYVDLLVDKAAAPREVIALGRMVAAWPASATTAPHLRYVLEQAAAAALRSRSLAAAQACLDRLAELAKLGGRPRSDYWADDRKEKTPTPLADAEVKQLRAQLASGALDREAREAREAAAAAREAGAPIRADDARLATLLGAQIECRLVTAGHEVWLFDEAGALRVYDGYDVGLVPCEVVRGTDAHDDDSVARLLAGGAQLDDRATLLGKGDRVREVLRYGARVLVLDLSHGPWSRPIGLAFPDHAGARRAFELLRDHPPDGCARSDAWYVAGRGALRRSYAALHDRKWVEGSVAVLDATLEVHAFEGFPAPEQTTFASADAARAAFEAWETARYVAGARLKLLAIDASTTRREDTTILRYLEHRHRNDARDARWHLRGLAEMWQAIVDAELADQAPDIEVELAPPASEGDIAAYQALVPEPLPRALIELWRAHGGGGFRTATHRYRLLSPRELADARETLRAQHRAWIAAHCKPAVRATRLAVVERVDVIAVVDDQPLIVFDTHQEQSDGTCFAAVRDDYYETPLSRRLALDLTAAFKDELERRLGDIARLACGQRPGRATQRIQLARGDKRWEAILDGDQLLTRVVAPAGVGHLAIKRHATAAAAKLALDAALDAARAKGYR